MAHTPGPWFVNGDCVEADGPEGPRDVTVAVVHRHPHNTVRAANARLIAAAPDLYAVCKLLFASMGEVIADHNEVAYSDLRMALMKAEGET